MELPVVFNNRYQLIKKIGEGGLAEVYQAQDMALGRMVAVKALRPQYTRDSNFLVNFHREAQSVARLSDTFIVAVYDFGQDKERPYIVFEWIPGSDLRTVLDEQKIIPVEQAVEYAIQICSAVGAAHRAGLVHGDLKPGNILITPNNQAKVTDFGLARALGESAMDDGEVVWGTPTYFAPEQASGDRVLPATDVYAIGIILYEMLIGRVPFVGLDDQEIARRQIYEAHIPIDQINPNIPEPVARIVDASMAKNPNERFLTADHLREALLMYKQGRLTTTGTQAPISAVVGSPLQAVGLSIHVSGRPSSHPLPHHYVSASQAGAHKKKSSGFSFDLMAIAFGLVVVAVVFGLVLLFAAISAAYLQNGNWSTPAQTSSGQLRMPDLVGLPQDAAKTALENMGLIMVVGEEESHPTWPAFTIIRQSVPAGDFIRAGSRINVVLSRGPAVLELPDVKGMRFEEAQQLLLSMDLVPQKYEDWSAETPGQVIEQNPPAGAVVESRTLITLIVSNGARVPIGANFAGQILLNAYEVPRIQYKPGESAGLTFFWQAVTPIPENYILFIYLTTPQGGVVSKIETPPQNGAKPTSQWKMGDIMVDPYQLPIPITTAPGDYQIRIAFGQTGGNRIPIVESGRGERDNLGALILRSVQVVP